MGTASELDVAGRCADAQAALEQLGWKPATARGAVRAAKAVLGASATLEQMILEALRRCPRPSMTS